MLLSILSFIWKVIAHFIFHLIELRGDLREFARFLQISRDFFVGQIVFELKHLGSQIIDDLIVFWNLKSSIEYIPFHFSFYILSSWSVFQSIWSFFISRVDWRNAGNHDCPWVTTKWVLQNSGQLWISIWDKISRSFWVILIKQIDAISKCKKRLVNICAFH